MDNPFKVFLEKNSNPAGAVVPVQMVTTSGRYTLGPAKRPNIVHDNGFLDKYPPRSCTAADYASWVWWGKKMEGAYALRPDLWEAINAYRHFRNGNGKDRHFDYKKFIEEDPSGFKIVSTLVYEAVDAIEDIGKNRLAFEVTSEAQDTSDKIGGTPGNRSKPGSQFSPGNLPYPLTENWQKAIGAHKLWVSARVTISANGADLNVVADITIHAEDRYNFNPGAADIATKTPDADNGQFELCGLAKQYTNFGEAYVAASWVYGQKGSVVFAVK